MSRKKSNSVTAGREMGKVEWEAVFVPGLLNRSSRSVNEIHRCLRRFGRRMEEAYGLTSITEINRELIELYFVEIADLSARSITSHAMALRILCDMMGVPEIIPTNSQLGCARMSQKLNASTLTVADDDQKK